MLKESVMVKNRTGVHARPAGMLVKAAGQFESTIQLVYQGKAINARGIMAVLGAGIVGGAEVELICDGADEQQAFATIKALFVSGFGED